MSRSSSRASSKDSLLSSDDDSAFFAAYAAARHKAMTAPFVDPTTLVLQVLKTTKIPYAIIGGKAAAFHISRLPPPKTSGSRSPRSNLALSTNDYDILVKHAHGKELVEALQTELKNKTTTQFDEKIFESDVVEIVMTGIRKKDLFDSIVDIHILKPAYENKFPAKIVIDSTGLKYADHAWVCNELAYSLKYHTSSDEMTKAMKRQARSELLNCTSPQP